LPDKEQRVAVPSQNNFREGHFVENKILPAANYYSIRR